jgi:hypothetical protein
MIMLYKLLRGRVENREIAKQVPANFGTIRWAHSHHALETAMSGCACSIPTDPVSVQPGIRCREICLRSRHRQKRNLRRNRGRYSALQLFTNDDKVEKVRVNMGTPRLTRAEIPRSATAAKSVANRQYRLQPFITCVSMGNPTGHFCG